jgi:hypothetical protein
MTVNKLISIAVLCAQITSVAFGAGCRISDRSKMAICPSKTSMELRHGWTPLHRAARSNNMDKANRLVAAGVNLEVIDAHGDTPLHMAVHFNSADVATILIKAGASLEAKNRNGDTLLDVAVRGANRALVEMLLSAGVNGIDTALEYLLHQNTGKRLERKKSLVREGCRTIGDPEYLMRERACARLLIVFGATTSNPEYQALFNEIRTEPETIKLWQEKHFA